MTQQSLLLTAPKQLQWIAKSMPQLQLDEVLVQTCTGAISLGTELQYYRGKHRGSSAIQYPVMTGYESVGVVLRCGTNVRNVEVGDRILASYGHRTHAVLKESKVIPIPADISDALAIMAILSCDVTKGIAKINLKTNDRVLITGAGTIGLLTLFNLVAQGVNVVEIVEPIAYRRKFSLQFGAAKAIDPAEMTLNGNYYQVGFECSGRNQAFAILQQSMRAGGQICILSDGNIEPLTLDPYFHEKELNIIGSSDGEDYPGHAAWFFEQVRKLNTPLQNLYQQEIRANQLIGCFAEIAASNQPPLKVLVDYTHS